MTVSLKTVKQKSATL